MSSAVSFDYTAWVTRYPEFSGVSSDSAQLYFNEATLYCANKLNPVPDLTTLQTLLNMLTAHIAQLNSPTTVAGASSATPPGRVANATEGSVSVQFENQYPPGSAQWYQQTKYGSAYWEATKRFRLFRYRRNRCGPASMGTLPWIYPNTGS